MKDFLNKNSLPSGLLIRSFPILFVFVLVSSAIFSVGFIRWSNQTIEETAKLRTESIASQIDDELELAIAVLRAHIQNWGKNPLKSETVGPFLRKLTELNRGFVFHAVSTGKGVDRYGVEIEFSDRFIAELEFFDLPKLGMKTSGFSAVYTKSLDMWFEFALTDSSGNYQLVRSLYRFSRYYKHVAAALSTAPQTLVVIKPEASKGSRLPLGNQDNEVLRAKVPELSPTRRYEEIDLLGSSHLAYSSRLRNFPAEIIYAPLKAEIVGTRPYVLTLFCVLLLSGVALVGFVMYRYGKKQRAFVDTVIENVRRVSVGDEQASFPESDVTEFQLMSTSIGELMKTQNENRVRSKVLNKGMFELFACNDSQAAVMKCVELICTQCFAETSWFEPFVADQDFYRLERNRDKIIMGWQWKNHRINEIDKDMILYLQNTHPERNVASYAIKSGLEAIGTLKAFYKDGVGDLTRLMLDSLVSILEKTLTRHEAIKKGVLLSTELDIAKTIQKSVVSSGATIESDGRVAQYYKPADRLGGDWFYIIPNRDQDSCYVIMGSVSGGGISQGLLTSGVKGGLDVLDYLIRQTTIDPFGSPAEIIPVLQRIVAAMNKMTDSVITCFVAHVNFTTGRLTVANQGHSLPVIVREGTGRPAAVHFLNDLAETKLVNGIPTLETTLTKGDYLVAFSDGLTNAKGFKSEIFERFMVSAVESSQGYVSSSDLCEDLKHIYNYYTSNKKQNDDVCFMVIKVEEQDQMQKSA